MKNTVVESLPGSILPVSHSPLALGDTPEVEVWDTGSLLIQITLVPAVTVMF